MTTTRTIATTTHVTRATLTLSPDRHPHRVLAAAIRSAVEPPVVCDDVEACAFEERAPVVGVEPCELHRALAARTAHRQRQHPPLDVPVGALEDPRLPLEPASVRLRDVVRPGGEDVERERPPGEQELARGAERSQPFVVVVEMEERTERARHERYALGDRRIAEVADAEVEERCDAGLRGGLRADLEHPARRVHPDHADACCRGGHRDAPGPDPELDHGPSGLARQVDVELDVLDDADRPRVVQARDRVVRAHGLRATNTYSRDSSVNGSRAKPPYSASTSRPATSTRPSHSFFVAHQSEISSPESSVMSMRLSPTAYRSVCGTGAGSRCPSSRIAIAWSNANAFHAKRPPGRSDTATRSNTRRRSLHVGRWRSDLAGQ